MIRPLVYMNTCDEKLEMKEELVCVSVLGVVRGNRWVIGVGFGFLLDGGHFFGGNASACLHTYNPRSLEFSRRQEPRSRPHPAKRAPRNSQRRFDRLLPPSHSLNSEGSSLPLRVYAWTYFDSLATFLYVAGSSW
jgi:hypothetical protein